MPVIIDTGGTDSSGSWRPTFGNNVSWPSSRNDSRQSYSPYTPTRTTGTRAGIEYQGMQPGWFPGATQPYYYPSFSWRSASRSQSTDYANASRQTTLEALRANTGRGNSAGMSSTLSSTSGMSYPRGEPMSHPGYKPPNKRYLPTFGTAGLTNAQRSALNADRQLADDMYYGPEGRLAQMVQQGLGLNLIPFDEDVHNEAFIGFAQDFGPGSYVIEQVGEDYRKRTLTYRRGMERLNPQAALGWSPGKVTGWRAQARFLSQFIDFGSNSPMGTDPNVWTEGDAAAMEWMMAAANETGRDVEQVMADYLQAAESGTLDAELMGGGGGGSGSAQSQAREVTRTDTTFSLTDLDDARTLIAGQMRNLMGRDPSDREVSAFLSALNTKEKATPSSIVVTNAEYNERGDLVSQETRRTQGDEIDRASMARSAALADGGMAEARRFHLARAQDVLAQMVGI